MKLYIVRHGQTAWNREGVFRGRKDVPLSETGIKQAELLAARLEGEGIKRLISSPPSRATATAQIVAARLGLEVQVDERLTNLSYGSWEGRGKDEVEKEFPELYAQWKARPASVRFPDGEALADLEARALPAALEFSAGAGSAAIVTHRMVAKVLVLRLLGRSLDDFWKLELGTASVTVIRCDGGGRVLELENDTAHLSGLGAGEADI